MSTVRFNALKILLSRKAKEVKYPSVKASDYFGVNVFDRAKMKKYLDKNVYQSVIKTIDCGNYIDRNIADQVASGMKEWAISRGASHYTHWFHPLTDATAEKHDSFFDMTQNGETFESFNGKVLVQQEPDASSFPNGGIRNTFEARGYTAWDPSSPAFVAGKTLCIPTIFISYTGEALDYKTPLLKSLYALDKAAVDVCKYFDDKITKVISTLGIEQEYFLIDNALFQARPDLSLTNRTLMGHSASKDQQLDDHYFGAIKPRTSAYMMELEIEAHKLGIPLKTRHNEVAPNQFECAPIFEEANLAVDHNQLLMNVMQTVATRHNLKVLLHEKPFAGINGSGKHNNWSLSTNTGINLLSPGKTPERNMQFLTFFINTLKAVHDNADVLRASIMSAGNQHRLGGNEAPPAIISAFIGSKLTEILNEIEASPVNHNLVVEDNTALKLNVGKIPEILIDNTDRNRTSPFAFTGNRFEFRAVGSSENCSSPLIVLNTIVANQLNLFKNDVDKLIKENAKKEDAIFTVLRKYVKQSKNIRFEGNGYSQEWVKEAKRRGLSNITEAMEAYKSYLEPRVVDLFERNNVLNKRELKARYEVRVENWIKKIQIEARVLGDLAINHIVPTCIKYQSALIQNIKGIKDLFGEDEYLQLSSGTIATVKQISHHVSNVRRLVDELIKERRRANLISNSSLKGIEYEQTVKPYLESIRYHIDKLELIVDDQLWTLPKYRELLFN